MWFYSNTGKLNFKVVLVADHLMFDSIESEVVNEFSQLVESYLSCLQKNHVVQEIF